MDDSVLDAKIAAAIDRNVKAIAERQERSRDMFAGMEDTIPIIHDPDFCLDDWRDFRIPPWDGPV